MINKTENIRKALDDRNIVCGVFVDFQKAFDTVDHQILQQYDNSGVTNGWLKSYLSNGNQYVSINGYDSGLAAVNCDVPQRSVLNKILHGSPHCWWHWSIISE